MNPVSAIRPFGAIWRAAGQPLDSIPIETLLAALDRHRVVALRGFVPPDPDGLTRFAARLGELLAWDFGAVNELRAAPDARNYLYTTAAVPFHWDGAFVGRIPAWIVFHCVEAPAADAGGETLFADAIGLLDDVGPERRRCWEGVRITYRTERIVHYGGSFTAPLIGRHPRTGEAVLRYAEPVADLNPVSLAIEGIPDGERDAFIADLARRLRAPERCLAWTWRPGDVLIADNHALLHGRAAYRDPGSRHLRRVNVL